MGRRGLEHNRRRRQGWTENRAKTMSVDLPLLSHISGNVELSTLNQLKTGLKYINKLHLESKEKKEVLIYQQEKDRGFT